MSPSAPAPARPTALKTAAAPAAPADVHHSAFYRFTPVADPAASAQALRVLCQSQGLLGSIVVAPEGVNGTVAGGSSQLAALEKALQLPSLLAGALCGMVFKHSACTTVPFARLKVSVKPEIVALGWPDPRAGDPADPGLPGPDENDASHLTAPAWRALMARDDVVLLDNRNHFEYRLGHFRGAVDPRVNNFRDFVAYVQQQAPAWRRAGRPVAMYCTGGIRCDKTAPWLRSLGLEVWQLEGGILGYLQQADGEDDTWLGECFVFDKRIALDSRLQEAATTAEQVYNPLQPDEAWRLQRALRLDAATEVDAQPPPSWMRSVQK